VRYHVSDGIHDPGSYGVGEPGLKIADAVSESVQMADHKLTHFLPRSRKI